MMKILAATLLVYALGLLFTAVGSRLAGRCTTWCCALLGLPMWVVGGTVAPFCLALPQLMLAFLAAGMSVTALAIGTALAGAVTNLGLALSVCLLRKRHCAVADRDEFCRKCLLLLAACGVLAVFVRDGELSYTGTGLLMLLFVLFVMMSIVFQHKFTYGDTIKAVSTSEKHPSPQLAAQEYGYTAHTMAFPVMSVRNALTNLAGVVGGLALLAGGIAPLFAPLGFGDWRVSTALITGFMAKESVVSTLTILFGSSAAFAAALTPAQAAPLLVFCLLYTPCIAAVASVKRELGGKWAAIMVVNQCVTAWLCALVMRLILLAI